MNYLNFWGGGGMGPGMGMIGWLSSPMFYLLLIWSLFWKGLALWHAGRRGQPWWFVIMLVLNTAGLLELIYLFAILKVQPQKLFDK